MHPRRAAERALSPPAGRKYYGQSPRRRRLWPALSVQTLILVLFHAVLAPITALHALISKREPRGAFAWIAVCVLAPLAGPLLYLLFGVNRIRSRAQRFALPAFVPAEPDPHEKLAAASDAVDLPVDTPPSPYRHPLLAGHMVEPLFNGEQAYPAMLEAIESAREQICLTTYIFGSDRSGQAFIDALTRAAQRGVEVRVIIDGFGELYSFPPASRLLARAGVHVARFLPPRLFPPSLSINMRNHHKILTVDNRVGFTGGMNISDRHRVDDPGQTTPTADIHFCIHGPVVAQLSTEFLRTWTLSTGELFEYPPAVADAGGPFHCRVIADGPDEEIDHLTTLLAAAVASARDSVRIMTPYFLPPRELIGALQAAAARGIDVHVVIPEKSNLRYIDWATRNMLWELLQRGVRVSLQPAPFNHGKLFVVDDNYSLIGSANWDPRSLRLNFELQVEIHGRLCAAALSHYIEKRAEAGRKITLAEVDQRGFLIRLRDSLCWLLSPFL